MLPYPQRRAALEAALTLSPRLRLTTAAEITDPAALDAMFAQAVTDGCEGLVCKSTGPDSAYQAGARGWQWIKLKRDYRTELSDTADLVVIGAFAGRGRRTGVYGAVLLAAYDADADAFRAVTKCGAGFSDADLAALPARLAPLLSPHQPARVDSRQEPDVWFEPGLVLEILSAELTLSPNYTAAWGQIEDDAGLAMRFPGSPGAGATTRPRKTPPPPGSWPNCSSPPGARPPAASLPTEGRGYAAVSCALMIFVFRPVRRPDRRPAERSWSRGATGSRRARGGAVPRGRARGLLVGARRWGRRPRAPHRPRGHRGRADGRAGPVGGRVPCLGRTRRLPRHRQGSDRQAGTAVPAEVLRDRLNAWFPLGRHLVAGLYQTARSIESTARQRASLITLGKLAAGLAHEINNPAAAATRAVDDLEGAARRCSPSGGSPTTRSRRGSSPRSTRCASSSSPARRRDPLAMADREEALALACRAWRRR